MVGDENGFTDADLRDLIRMCRSRADLARLDAERQKGTSLAAGIAINQAKHYDRIGAKCDSMRAGPPIPDNVVRLKPGATHTCNRGGSSVEVTWTHRRARSARTPQVFN